MKTLQELSQDAAALRVDLEGILDGAKKAGRTTLNNDEDGRYSEFETRRNDILAELKTRGRQTDIDQARAWEGQTPPLVPPDLHDSPQRSGNGHFGARPEYRNLFGNPGTGFNGFKDAEEFLRAVVYRQASPEARAMLESIPSAGGFAVPEVLAAQWLDSALEDEIVRPRATTYPMSSDSLKVPGFDGGDHSSTLFGGLTAVWGNEGSTATDTDAKTRQLQLGANRLRLYTTASLELVADGVGFAVQLESAMAQAVSFELDYAFLTGSGAGRPKGILNDSALVTVNKETGQLANTVVSENILKMWSRLYGPCKQRAVWVINHDVIPQLYGMGITVGVGGAPWFVPAGGLSRSPFNTLLGRPVLPTEKVSTLGTKGDIVLADLSQYAVGLRKEISLDTSDAPAWYEGLRSFRIIMRAGGQGTWDAPITPRTGQTLSWVVTLATRN